MPLYYDHLVSPTSTLIGACGKFQTLLASFPGRLYASQRWCLLGIWAYMQIIPCSDQLSSLVNLPSSFICSAKMYSKYLRGSVVSIKCFRTDGICEFLDSPMRLNHSINLNSQIGTQEDSVHVVTQSDRMFPIKLPLSFRRRIR
jgi:hypothetical protein